MICFLFCGFEGGKKNSFFITHDYHCRAALCAVIMLLASAQNWVQVSCVMPIFQ